MNLSTGDGGGGTKATGVRPEFDSWLLLLANFRLPPALRPAESPTSERSEAGGRGRPRQRQEVGAAGSYDHPSKAQGKASQLRKTEASEWGALPAPAPAPLDIRGLSGGLPTRSCAPSSPGTLSPGTFSLRRSGALGDPGGDGDSLQRAVKCTAGGLEAEVMEPS